jgi:DNA-binding transcriptional ArsR family regulator
MQTHETDGEGFSGQAEGAVLNYEQIQCLASPIRNEVFWAFTAHLPHSAADVAQQIGKSAQTVHYHVSQLLDAGLIIPVGERRRRARTETLYVWAFKTFTHPGPAASKEFRDESVRAFSAVMRSIIREVETLHQVAEIDPELATAAAFRHGKVKVTRKRALELKALLQKAIDEAKELEEDSPDALRFHILIYSGPTRGETLSLLRKAGRSTSDEEDEG